MGTVLTNPPLVPHSGTVVAPNTNSPFARGESTRYSIFPIDPTVLNGVFPKHEPCGDAIAMSTGYLNQDQVRRWFTRNSTVTPVLHPILHSPSYFSKKQAHSSLPELSVMPSHSHHLPKPILPLKANSLGFPQQSLGQNLQAPLCFLPNQ